MGDDIVHLLPLVRLVVVVDITKHEARVEFMNNDPNVPANANRPEVSVSRHELVKLHARAFRIEMQLERC